MMIGFNTAAIMAVHPHECGEHDDRVQHGGDHGGSSPRVRGTFVERNFAGFQTRFIPTSAGNIRHTPNLIIQRAVHPHECGEHSFFNDTVEASSGSSPRVRGTYLNQKATHFRSRFIPTSAGNIGFRLHQCCGNAVHPHECGEH